MKSKFISGYELTRIQFAMHPHLWVPFALALETGLRIGDIAKIKKSDIFEENDCFFVHFVANKTKKEGKAQISEPLAKALLNAPSDIWCFPSPKNKGEHITRQALHTRLKSACKRAKLSADGISPHSMRKNFAVELYHKEGIKSVVKALQHESLTTAEIYALADWLTGDNAKKPLLREDIVRIIEAVISALDKKFKMCYDEEN